MAAGSGKRKGGSFERDVCRDLSLWVSGGKRKDCFWRSAMSGGRQTVQRKKGEANVTQGGDISAIDPLGHKLLEHFVVECKFYRDLNVAQGLLLGYGTLHKFWREAAKLGKRCDRAPILIARQNLFPTLFCTDLEGRDRLGLHNTVRCLVYHRDGARGMYVCKFEEVLKEVTPP